MNRKRTPNESFAQYRTNMKAEAAALKQRLAGTFFHVSTTNPPTRNHGSTYRR